MVRVLKIIKHRDYQGLYRLAKAKPGLVRGLFGVSGQDYYEFTTEGVLLPGVFLNLEWHCFMTIFKTLESDSKFKSSPEYTTYLTLKEEDQAHKHEELIKDYEKYRLMKIQQWTRGFQVQERSMFDKAGEIVDVFMNREIEKIYRQVEKEQVRKRVAEIRHEQQSIHEATAMLAEDAFFWVEDNILDSLFDHYTTSLINKMLEIPECRKGLLQYSGFLKTQSRHMQIDHSVKTGKEEWFTEFYKNARKSEKGALPLDSLKSVITIQRRVRGILQRKKVRKLFMKTYVKMYDPTANAAFYKNQKTGEVSWSRPAMTKHLYHKSNW